MKTMALLSGLAVMLLLAGGGCQGRTSYFGEGSAGGAGTGGGAGNTRGRSRQGTVSLSAQDLAPVDAYISARNGQWILGDEVEVLASKEYFGQNLTINATVGLHDRKDTTSPAETVVVLTYSGDPGQASAMTNPRVLVGTGLTVTARKKLTVRLYKTTDGTRPVVLRVSARGKASYGRKEEVLERGEMLTVGGELLSIQGRTTWKPYR